VIHTLQNLITLGKEVIEAVHKLNSRPRKCLNYATPYEVFRELTGIDAIILVKGIHL